MTSVWLTKNLVENIKLTKNFTDLIYGSLSQSQTYGSLNILLTSIRLTNCLPDKHTGY